MAIRKVRTTATATALAVAVAISAACARSAPRSHVVTMSNFAFQPAELIVSRGDTIVWNNSDFVPHSATARDGSWDSKSVAAGGSWRFVASAKGRHEYYCIFHPTMKGTIEVR